MCVCVDLTSDKRCRHLTKSDSGYDSDSYFHSGTHTQSGLHVRVIRSAACLLLPRGTSCTAISWLFEVLGSANDEFVAFAAAVAVAHN